MKICSQCGIEKEISQFNKHKLHKDKLCSACNKCRKKSGLIYKQNFPWKLTLSAIKRRCNNKNNPAYKYYGGRGIKCLITESELKELWFRDKAFKMKLPSIDRIDNNGNYIFNNCKYIERIDNSLKMVENQKIAIIQFDNQGKFIKEWNSLSEAFHTLKIYNICEVLKNHRKMAGGYIWKYKEK
jgi:hypothetical protein